MIHYILFWGILVYGSSMLLVFLAIIGSLMPTSLSWKVTIELAAAFAGTGILWSVPVWLLNELA
jgi:hypothetical protein